MSRFGNNMIDCNKDYPIITNMVINKAKWWNKDLEQEGILEIFFNTDVV